MSATLRDAGAPSAVYVRAHAATAAPDRVGDGDAPERASIRESV